MRRIVPLLLVAVIAFAAGEAGANGTLSRLLADAHVPGVNTATATAVAGAAATLPPARATTAGIVAAVPTVIAIVSGAHKTPVATATAVPAATASATPIPPPPAVLSLTQSTAAHTALSANGWAGASGVTLTVMAPAGAANLRAEVELRPDGQSFSGTATGVALVDHGVAVIAPTGLTAGHYHWQARLTSAGGAGVWSAFAHGGTAFNVQITPPPAPVIASPSNPSAKATYATSTLSFTWPAPADPAGIAGYSYRLDKDTHGEPHLVMRTQAQHIMLGGLGSGVYYFHLRAVDSVGNWGPSSTYAVHVDVTPPRITHSNVSAYYVNPALESLSFTYTLTKVSHLTVGIYNNAGDRVRHLVPAPLMPAGVPLTIRWDGRDNAGKVVPAGMYSIFMRVTDRLGNSNVIPWGGYNVSDKRIVVSLTQQRLWAYQGNTLFMTTLVTTGNKDLPTPTGIFHIMFARHPFTFISPWPKSSPYWYKPSPVSYALYFKDYGYYIHDAPWRSNFGPGSNTITGTPGSNTTGTHGCVNVPRPVMQQLYAWATPGTAVQVTP